MNASLRRALLDAVDLACPSSCVGCDAWGPVWCGACESTLTGVSRVVVPRLAPHLAVHAAEEFDGPLRRGISAFKDDGRRDAGGSLARLARRAVSAALEGTALCEQAGAVDARITLVPVPSSRAAFRVRGRYPLGEIAVQVRRGTPIRDGTGILAHRRRVRDQSGLDLAGRRRNVDGAFRVRPESGVRRGGEASWLSGTVVLLDDVVTSGATLSAAHDALEAAGARRIVCAAVAATPPS